MLEKYAWVALIAVFMIPLIAILDYYAFHGLYEKMGRYTPKHAWVVACFLESTLFLAGIGVGALIFGGC